MHTLIVRHATGNGFRVLCPDGKSTHEVVLDPPVAVKVEGRLIFEDAAGEPDLI